MWKVITIYYCGKIPQIKTTETPTKNCHKKILPCTVGRKSSINGYISPENQYLFSLAETIQQLPLVFPPIKSIYLETLTDRMRDNGDNDEIGLRKERSQNSYALLLSYDYHALSTFLQSNTIFYTGLYSNIL